MFDIKVWVFVQNWNFVWWPRWYRNKITWKWKKKFFFVTRAQKKFKIFSKTNFRTSLETVYLNNCHKNSILVYFQLNAWKQKILNEEIMSSILYHSEGRRQLHRWMLWRIWTSYPEVTLIWANSVRSATWAPQPKESSQASNTVTLGNQDSKSQTSF